MVTVIDRPAAEEMVFRDSSVAALDRALEELASVVVALGPDAYTARLFPASSGSIGEHVRHCLDHVAALVSADPSACLSYDHRERGTAVETDRVQALRSLQLLRLKIAVGRWSTRLDEPICVISAMAPGGVMLSGMSTLARELAFVLNHTIHHQAMIGLLATLLGCDLPDGFGFAPSTPRQ